MEELYKGKDLDPLLILPLGIPRLSTKELLKASPRHCYFSLNGTFYRSTP